MELLDAARAAVDAAQRDPQAALDAATEILAAEPSDAGVRATASWAAGLAHRELNALATAEDFLVRAVEIATAAELPAIAAGARISRALVLTYLGRAEDGLAELDIVQKTLDGPELARLQMQRALILQRLGRLDEALVGYNSALPALMATGDKLAEVRLRVNRGIALTYRNRLPAAAADLVTAHRLAADLGQSMQVAACAHNLGFLHGRRGDIPRFLEWFDQAKAEYAQLGVDAGLSAVLLGDRAEVLLDGGLYAEALACSRQAVLLLTGTGNAVELAEARLTVARAAQAVGDHQSAAAQASLARDSFTEQGRPTWAALARYLAFVSLDSVATNVPSASDLDDLQALTDDLAAAGWSLEASSARALLGRFALANGDLDRAARELRVAARARLAGSAAYRASGWYAEALRRVASDDRRGARRAIKAGLGIIDRYRATLGAADLRAHMAAHGDRLASLLVTLAIDDRRGRDILTAAESWRAGSLSIPVRPPTDPVLAELLSALRARAAERRSGAVAEPDRETARLEVAIRDVARSRSAGSVVSARRAFDWPAVKRELGSRMLVEWVVHDGELHVVWIFDGRTRWARLGKVADVLTEVDSMRMCLHRMARAAGSVRSLAIAAQTLAATANAVSRMLFGPIEQLVAERELVLIPTGALHRIPWSALDVVRRTPYVVAPSLRSWLQAVGAPKRPPSLLVAAGPGLPGAAAEAEAIARSQPEATLLRPNEATVAAVLGQLARVSVAHLATHGRFRADNPQFSSLSFVDGELTVYDLQSLPQVPAVLVLAACDAATAAIRPGDELLGLSAALLGLGASSLIAPSVPVPDSATADIMVDLQRQLAAGTRAPVALCHAIESSRGAQDPQTMAAARSFVTLGS